MCFTFTLAAQLVFLSDSCELQGYRPVIRAPDLCLAGQKMGAPSDTRAFSVTLDCMCNMMEKKKTGCSRVGLEGARMTPKEGRVLRGIRYENSSEMQGLCRGAGESSRN